MSKHQVGSIKQDSLDTLCVLCLCVQPGPERLTLTLTHSITEFITFWCFIGTDCVVCQIESLPASWDKV